MLGPARPLLLALMLAFSASAAAESFVMGTSDVPLMPGLSPLGGEGTVFDVPGGRVVEAWAQGSTDRQAVLSFYGTTLPQLGWTALEAGLFRRDGEALRVEFPASGPGGRQAAGRLFVRFYLSPG